MKIVKGIAIIENDSHISKWVQQSGRLDHDQNMLPHVLKYIKKGDTVVDAGAFIGDHTIAYVNAVGEMGSVIAFEPHKPAFDCLRYNMQNFENVRCFNVGLSDTLGALGTVCENENTGMAFMAGEGEVPVIELDSLGLLRLDFLKIDVEGMELEVLRGAQKTIKKCSPVMLIEINRATLERKGVKVTDVLNYLNELGYAFANVYPGQPLCGEQFDVICQRIIS